MKRALASILALGLVLSCGRGPRFPEGAFLAGEAEPFVRFLGRLESLSGTPLAQLAASTRGRLEGCESVAGQSAGAGLAELFESLDCSEDGLPVLDELREGYDVAWGLPAGDGHLIGRGRLEDDGSATLELDLPDLPGDGPAALLLPGAEGPGPALLSGQDALIQGRFRADHGLDVARLVPEGGEVERFYKLKSRLFSGLVLRDVWELAVYMPDEGAEIPPIVLAVEFARRGPAVEALEGFMNEIEAEWRLVRSPYSAGGADGACFTGLRILPELAPCYVVTERAVILGWNAAAVAKALDGEAPDDLGEQSGLIVELGRLPEADARLTRGLPVDDAAATQAPMAYPWQRLIASGLRDGNRYRFEVRLTSPGT